MYFSFKKIENKNACIQNKIQVYGITLTLDPVYLSQVTKIAALNKGSYFNTSTKLSPI